MLCPLLLNHHNIQNYTYLTLKFDPYLDSILKFLSDEF